MALRIGTLFWTLLTTHYTPIKSTAFGLAKYPSLIKKFNDGHRTFTCNRHGTHDNWALTKQKVGNEYIRCRPCYKEAAEHHTFHHPLYAIFNYARQHARKEKGLFNIQLKDIEDVYYKQQRKCRYTRIEFNKTNYRPSLDQIIPQGGYTADNIQLVLIDINLMKSDFPESEFLKFCSLVAKPQKKGSGESVLPLLQDMKRQTNWTEINKKLKEFILNGMAYCEIHGLHSRWYQDKARKIIKCGECQLDYHREKDGVSAAVRKSKRLAERKRKREYDQTNLKNFLQGKACNCQTHGTHFDFRIMKVKTSAGTKIDTIRCKLCAKEDAKSRRDRNPLNSSFTVAKYRAKKIGRSFTITFDDVIELYKRQRGRCNLSGVVFDNAEKRPSIDRIDSTLGYDKDNVSLILYSLNRMKSDLNGKVFNNLCRKTHQNNHRV